MPWHTLQQEVSDSMHTVLPGSSSSTTAGQTIGSAWQRAGGAIVAVCCHANLASIWAYNTSRVPHIPPLFPTYTSQAGIVHILTYTCHITRICTPGSNKEVQDVSNKLDTYVYVAPMAVPLWLVGKGLVLDSKMGMALWAHYVA